MKNKIEHRYVEVANSSVLDAERHRTIINDIDYLCERARVPIWAVCRPLAQSCSEAEVEWVRTLRQHQRDRSGGLLLVGSVADIEVRIAAIAGACIRNFIDAQVMTLQQVNKALSADSMPQPTVLLVPNFYLRKEGGGHIATWEIAPLLGLLMERHALGKLNVLYVQSMGSLMGDWGKPLFNHLETYYDQIEVNS